MKPELEEIMLRVSQSPLIDAGAQEAAVRLVLGSVCEGLAIARAGVWFFDESVSGIRCQLLIDRANQTETENILLTERDFPRYFDALQQERAVVANDACTDPATSEFRDGYLKPLGVTSMLDVPIRHHGRVIGIICAEHTGPMRMWNPDEVTFASGLADLVGRAINAHISQHAQDELAELNRQLESKVVARTTDLEAAIQRLRQTQDDLIQSEKLASLGQVVAGIAHELNTPIGNAMTVIPTIADRAAQLKAMVEGGSMRKSDLVDGLIAISEMCCLADRSVNRAGALVASFKQVAVDQVSERRRPFDLRDVVEENLDTLGPGLKHQPWLIDNQVPPGIACDGFPGPLGQVLTNLIQNAVTHGLAGRSAGRVEISAHSDGRLMELSVADDGVGIDSVTVMRAFEPFYTTKLGQGGSGLGLAICYRIVTTVLAGEIRLQASPGTGTRVTVYMPVRIPGAL